MNLPWRSWLGLPPVSAAGLAYRHATPRRLPGRTPLEEITWMALDAETTGFDTQRDRVLSLALAPIRTLRLELAGMENWLVYQPAAPLNAAVTVHGILPSETAAGEPEDEVLAGLLRSVSGAVLVGHHIGFDVAMLNAALQRHHRITLRNPVVDTAILAMRAVEAFGKTAYPGQQPPSLDEVCEHLGLPTVERHTAAGDAFTTAELFLVLCARLQRLRGRPLVLADLPVERA
jgi:DNA polymerase-3 subunit epsilon